MAMTDRGTPPELPPGLLEEYLAGMHAELATLAAIAERLAAASDDREALEALRRATHKIHGSAGSRSEEHTSELQSLAYLVCRLLLEQKKRSKPSAPPFKALPRTPARGH